MPLRTAMPTIPKFPVRQEDVLRWIQDFCVEAEVWFNKANQMITDDRNLILRDSQEITGDGFCVQPTAPYVDLHAVSGTFTSDSTTAIAKGVVRQFLILSNTGGANIIIKHNAQTFLLNLTDFTIPPLYSIFLRWDDVSGVWTQIGQI